ncbi:IclR family transcriptional regulator [Ferrovibrio sp.]|uniref:IclR family transcriptional regulator n=1 Tax=Ferrovibrio sp. TaxID=1917215 RepID=UPI0025C48E6E|nr:IclR family transcriptional regulator [Ferrovibrio sp.]MBX3456716.1 IclR family transcriptional regulator [Ferrovibrio sp.]
MSINQSLSRGLRILEAVGMHGPEVGVRELSRLLEIDKSIVSRLVITLAEQGFLEQNPSTRRYRIGPRAFQVGQRYSQSNPLYQVAYDELHRLAEDENVNVYMGVRSDTEFMYLCSIQSAQPSVFRINTGATGRLHTTSVGKVMLAAMDEAALHKLLPRLTLTRLTPYSITDQASLLADLRKVRQLGYAVSDEENLVGILSVGVPIRDSSGKVIAAVSSAVSKDRMPVDFMARMVEITERTAGIISGKLGAYPGAAFQQFEEPAIAG